ncbi:PREDICTED: uncharacterized protein LOC109231695 [Nicotiana attenuata]|uniref:uncharacterized protein LOC109231695 n=1 Tax=Nicotiana attenuata TaxID=49451 RepID=UPI000904DC6C|nr:PREDICTED: uncharacterized protein LOC109231695 [Nicotiana attenuata]
MRLWNKAAISKASWDIEHKSDRLWIRWLHAYYIKNQQFGQMAIPQQAGWMLMGNNVKISWKTLRFGNNARPKAQFTVWLQMQGRLLTVDRIASWGVSVDHECKLYNSQSETRDHIFMECPYSVKVWEGVLKWMQVPCFRTTQWEQLENWIIQRAKGKSQKAQVFKMVHTEWVHALWIERNQRRFEKRSRRAEQLVREITYVCNVRAHTRIKEMV